MEIIMRLRNVPGAREVMVENEYVFTEPEGMCGTWKEVFGNDNPIHIEIGMGKGTFITTLAGMNPDINYVGIEKYSSVTMSLDKNYDITNEQGRLAAKLNYLYGDNVVGSTTLSITGGDNSNESLLPYLSAKNNSTQLSPKRCIKINIWVIAGIVAVILIIFTIINNASLSKKRSKYSKRKLRF
jgi:hypothetical protein